MSDAATAQTEVEITHHVGLHARPAVAFTKLAKKYESAIRLRAVGADAWTDAKSIAKVMALKLRTGTVMELEADGADAEDAVAALADLVRRDFDEAQSG